MSKQRKPRSQADPKAVQADPTSVDNQQEETVVPEPQPEPEPTPEPEPKQEESREPRKPIEDEGTDPRETKTRDEILSLEERRATRIPIGRMQRLDALAAPYRDPKHYHRFVLDKPGRLEQHKLAGYEFQTDASGKHITFPSGSFHLHLMKLPIEFREEDLAAREADISQRVAKEIKLGDGEYVPEEHKGVLTASGQYQPED